MKQLSILILFCTVAAQAQFSLHTERTGNAKRYGEKNLFTAVISNERGNTAYTVRQELPFDVPYPAAYLNEQTGMLLLAYTFDGFIEAYNSSGKKIWTKIFFEGIGPNYERTITAAMGNTSIAILTSDVTLPKAKVQVFSIDGRKKWEYELPYKMGFEIAMSPDETFIAAGSYYAEEGKTETSSLLLSNATEVITATDVLFRKASFSTANRNVVLMSEREAAIISTAQKSEIARVHRESAKNIFTDVLWKNDELILQEAQVEFPAEGKFYFKNPAFTKYSSLGNKLTTEQMMNTTYSTSSLRKTQKAVQVIFDGKEHSIFEEKKN
ncbi:MAG: hypothetical protein H3C35_09080 [Bacteroidetes bacterium]|nr:hypothetical protein [Bacteroidota bacterium]